MAYSTRYLFKFDSVVNGIAYEIHIMEDGYAGGITQRSLGASPTLRRDNSGHVAGTSLEFLAECVVDGEFSILYTPDPFRFKVVLYQNDVAIWSGFVSPELYAEPDIAPPYDVNITAVDGLGELKRSTYQAQGATTIGRIITYLLSHTGLSLSVSQINSIVGGGTPIMDVVVDLDNMVGESCYDVLQSLLETMNAIITQRGNTWLIARENDMSAVDGGVTFGSMDDCAWWPVGQMRSEIIPAKRKVVVTAENSYKEILKNSDMSYDGEWEKGYTTIFDTQENAYLVGLYSISQTVNFAEPLAASLVLRVKARAKDADNQNGSLRFRIGMEGYVQGNAKGSYRLLPSQTNPDVLTWRSANSTAFFDKPLSPSQYTNSEKDATEIEIVLPFFRAVDRDFKTTCDSLTIDIYGGDAEDFYIYEASLQVEYQTKGVQDVLRINNGAREDAKEVGIAFYAGNIPNGLYGTPTGASGTIISQWSTNDFANLDYLAFIARDYAKGVALPRMNKSGKLNVGTSVGMPLLFMDSEGVAYFPKTLSWDLYNDEMDVNLVSLPNAIIEVESESIGEITGGTSPGSSTGSVGGGGVSGATTLDGLRDVTITEPKEGDTLMRIGKDWVNTPAIWSLDENGNLVTDKQVIIKNNLIVEGDTASGGEGGSVPVGITGILVDGMTYRDKNADGLVDITDAFEGLQEKIDLTNYYTRVEVDAQVDAINNEVSNKASQSDLDKVSGRVSTLEKAGYATQTYVNTAISNLNIGQYATKTYVGEQITALNIGQYLKSATAESTYAKITSLTAVDNRLKGIEAYFATSEDAGTQIDKWNEIVAFLDATEGTTLAGILEAYTLKSVYEAFVSSTNTALADRYTKKQTDSAISTALASYYTKNEIDGKVTTINNALADRYTKTQVDGIVTTINQSIASVDNKYAPTKTWADTLASLIVNENGNIRIKTNLIVNGDTSSGGVSGETAIGITGILLNGTTYRDENGDGIIDLGTITSGLTSVNWSDVQGRPTSLSQFNNDLGLAKVATSGSYNDLSNKPTIPTIPSSLKNPYALTFGGKTYDGSSAKTITAEDLGALTEHQSLAGYATQSWVEGKGYAVASGLGSLAYKNGLTASDVGALSTSGGTIESITQNLLTINNSASDAKNSYQYFSLKGEKKGRLGYNAEHGRGMHIYNEVSKAFLGINDDGTPIYNSNTLIHSGNIGSYKAGDSDKLGGVAPSGYAKNLLGSSMNIDDIREGLSGGKLYKATGTFPTSTYAYASLLEYGSSGYAGQFTNWNNDLYFRGCNGNSWKDWKTIAFTDSNVASATKLQTARTIWGQSFDGTGNVSGNLFLNNGSYVRAYLADGTSSANILGVNAKNSLLIGYGLQTTGVVSIYGKEIHFAPSGEIAKMLINSSGNVLVGTTADSGYKLDVNGNIRAFISGTGNRTISVANDYGRVGLIAASQRGLYNFSTDKFIIGSDGNNTFLMEGFVGIGTTSPAYKLEVNGDVRIKGNLIVTGDTASGGSAGTTTGGGMVFTLTSDIPTGTSIAQSRLDALGLTDTVITNMLDGKYQHLIINVNNYKTLYTITGYVSSTARRITFLCGGQMADTGDYYDLYQSNGGAWRIEYGEL